MKNKILTNNFKAAMIAALMLLMPGAAAAGGESKAVNNKISSSVMSLLSGQNGKVDSKGDMPDFAFPETVEKNARPLFEKALAEKNGVEALKYSIQLIVAGNLVSQSGFLKNVEMLDSAAEVMPQPYSSLFVLLEANLYRQLYDSDRWIFNKRNLPLDTYPDDPMSWSGELYAKKVLELVDKSMSGAASGYASPLRDISPVITNSEMAEKCGLTIGDFIVYNGVATLRAFDNGSRKEIIPFYKDRQVALSTPYEMCVAASKEMLENNFKHYEGGAYSPAFTIAISQLASALQDAEKKSFLDVWMKKLIHEEDDAWLLRDYFNLCNNWNFIDTPECRMLHSLMTDYLSRFNESESAEAVKFDLSQIEKKYVAASIPERFLPDVAVEASAELRNMNEAYVIIYRIPETKTGTGRFAVKNFPGNSKKIVSIPVKTDGSVPFSSKVKFEVPPLAPGHYVAVPSATPELSANWRDNVNQWSLNVISVSSIAIVTTSDRSVKESGRVYVVDARTQMPVAGAEVVCSSDNGKKIIKKGFTDKGGAFDVPAGYYDIVARKNGNVAQQWAGINFYDRKEEAVKMANILTDLSIYRPGDKVQFAAVGWTRKGAENSLLANEKMNVTLFDANGNKVDSLSLTTDESGRCNGSFKLPESGLLGTYELRASYDSAKNRFSGWRSLQVAEYKTPGFFVELSADSAQNYEAGDVVKIKGVAKTYSGLPLAGSEISYEVKWVPWWRNWIWGSVDASYGGKLSADDKGEFIIELPTENLKGTHFAEGVYSLTVDATSLSGETQSSSEFRFSLGKGLAVSPAIPDKVCIDGDSLKLNVPVYDMLGLPSVQEVVCDIKNADTGEKVFGGEFKSPALVLPSERFPSGRYSLTFNIVGDTTKVKSELVVFRNSDRKPPYPTPLWIPQHEIVAEDDSQSVDVSFGSGYAGSWILCVVSDTKGELKREWIKADDSNCVLKVNAPSDKERVWVTLSGMHDLNQMIQTVTVVPSSSKKKLTVKASSFRDKISAGDREEWKFSFTVDGKNAHDVSAFAVMSDKALNALAPFGWNFNIASEIRTNKVSVSASGVGMLQTSGIFSKQLKYVEIPYAVPGWNTYSYPLASMHNYRMVKETMALRSMSAKQTMADVDYDSANVVYAEDRAAYATGAVNDYAMAKEESAEEEVAVNGSVSHEPADAGGSGMKQEKLRPVDMPLAFFMPMLKSDSDGVVTVGFDTPDFNTTWQFQIAGYTEDLLTAGLIKDAVASKPVMVKSNPPRYLRTGDKAQIAAIMFNNSDTAANLAGEIQLFDVASGRVVASRNIESGNLAPSGQCVISIDYDVPADMSEVGLRVVAHSDRFSDGEQVVIPILPSSAPVVESLQFYMGQGHGVASIRIPKLKESANVTLKYCDNPVWECVLALPSILNPESVNILSVVKSLYANSTAVDIVKKYPAVKRGIKHALAQVEAGDSAALKSNLEKDEELKTVALNNTPWVNNASAETSRMRNLSSLLSADKAKVVIDKLVGDMKGLQNSDGGWSWCPEMRSSEFITENVILHLGMMKRGGCLPDGCDKMARKGIEYCDHELYDSFVKSKGQFSTVGMLRYLYARSFFNAGDGGSGFRKLKNAAMKQIADDWKHFSIYDKATAAVLFARTQGYERYAGIVLESLNQFASKSEDKGWWFDNLSSGFDGMPKLITTSRALEAYSEISPSAPAVDGLRQWLVLQKETEDWGANPYTVEVVEAILSSGSDWTESSAAPVFTLGGKVIDVPVSENIQGLVTLPLDAAAASGKELKVEKSSAGPVWGGVVSQYVAPIKDVKSAQSMNLKIEKKLYVVNNTPNGEILSEEDVKVGDKVRVTLTVTCDKDMDYVALIDERAACLEPSDQLSGYVVKDGLGVYREVRDTRTSFFIGFLPKGVNVISYDCYADRSGVYALGVASVQSQYSPLQSAHSAGKSFTVAE